MTQLLDRWRLGDLSAEYPLHHVRQTCAEYARKLERGAAFARRDVGGPVDFIDRNKTEIFSYFR